MNPLPTTVKEFALACENLSSDEIYHLFEDEIRIKNPKLHSEIYACADPGDSEPFRDACYHLGVKYNIRSLILY